MTELIYFTNQDILEGHAFCTDINISNNTVQFDKTYFYPKGGGQPADTGIIQNENFYAEIVNVVEEDSKVIHFFTNQKGNLNIKDKIYQKVNKDTRYLHSKLHTAGHLVDIAFTSFDFGKLPLLKTNLYPGSTSCTYKGDFSFDKKEAVKLIQEKCNELVGKSINVQIIHEESERFTVIGDYKTPCGGTHIKNTNEINKLVIKKIESKKGEVKVSFLVE